MAGADMSPAYLRTEPAGVWAVHPLKVMREKGNQQDNGNRYADEVK
jgi:hypothetical protein